MKRLGELFNVIKGFTLRYLELVVINIVIAVLFSLFSYKLLTYMIIAYIVLFTIVILLYKIRLTPIIALYLKYYYDFKIKTLYKRFCKNNETLYNKSLWKRMSRFIIEKLILRMDFSPIDCNIYESRSIHKQEPVKSPGQYHPIEPMEKEAMGKPLFIRRSHVMHKFFWKPWDYAITVLFGKLVLKREREHYYLIVNLKDEKYAIYNNAGKTFLLEKYVDLSNKERVSSLVNLSKEIHQCILVHKDYQIDLRTIPLRWASGGILPIVYYRGRHWLVLFYRNFIPMGWNLPLGASESIEEQIKIERLLLREALEELILLDHTPFHGAIAKQKIVIPPGIIDAEEERELIKKLISKYLRLHSELRLRQDRLQIIEGETIYAEPIPTPFRVRICDTHKCRNIPDVLFVINPLELGIEVIRAFVFRIEENDYILWGEIWKAAKVLPRTPVMLLSIDFIKEYISGNNGSFGKYISNNMCMDCKRLDYIPSNSYIMFIKDLEFLENRINYLKNKPKKTKRDLMELTYLKWFNTYKDQIYELKRTVLENKDLVTGKHDLFLTFCPVTWKAIEIMWKHGILDRVKNIIP